ncbi:MAG: cysteine--tRNA ligase [Candidatus Komeilibacteria bacterium CG_4_10_14_0_2_um_filter_37_10]|uniref:Cysteine--tRNA ligase n=1 Tax=Candidatus Komeilibacteria bacterium CG_4_10_14_0_2_um_filter_37_10 TaxID=1974470 RepID=A0A2M7VG79_9BACT|nr:MAG: cysteine--tRNA ligase [Candidatus Komeilibacteria bacterium CG_4_10_14_0_2_um_filter_37_10]
MPTIQLYNTLSRKKEIFQPLNENQLTFYSCGPTVYNYPHIGNLRAYVMNDLVKRTFLYNDYQVKHIINLTDVGHLTSDADDGEDKIEKAKLRENKTAWDIAAFYIKAFQDDCDLLNIITPTKYVRATDCIKEQLAVVKILDQKGYLYQTNDGLYLDTSKLKHYGLLAKLDIQGLKAGARIEQNPDKKNITDFAVWKFSPPNSHRDMEWDSPWGIGFPGWHLECSVISSLNLGQQFDLHSGGIEHIPVHHTNEIAQSEAAYGVIPAHYWLHINHLNLKSGKMAKSSGTFIRLQDLINKNIDPLAYRYYLLQTHYATAIVYTEEALLAAQTGFHNLQQRISTLTGKGKILPDYKNKFIELINNDFNSPQAMALVWEILKNDKLTDADKKTTILDFDQVLGLNLKKLKPLKIPQKIKLLATKRWQTKQNKNFTQADQLRQQIEIQGYLINDSADSYYIVKQ